MKKIKRFLTMLFLLPIMPIIGVEPTDPTNADDDATKPTDPPTAAAGADDGNQPNKEPEKTFTQAELDAILNDRLSRAKKGMPSKEDLAAFKEWQDSQKTEAEKQAEQLKQFAQAQKELEDTKNLNKVLLSKVLPDDADYVLFKVSKSVDEKTDFDTALKTFLEQNPKYTAQQEPPKPQPTPGGYKQGGGASQLSGIEEAFLKRNPGLKI